MVRMEQFKNTTFPRTFRFGCNRGGSFGTLIIQAEAQQYKCVLKFGRVAERLMATDCKSVAPCGLRRFESSPVHQLPTAPGAQSYGPL